MGGQEDTVLVVDDDAALRMLCRVNLELDDYRVLEAASLAQARKLLAAQQVAVVLLDVHVGPDDGRALLEQIRAEWPHVAVALFTGSAAPEMIANGTADAVLPKPFSLEALSSTVARLAGRR